MENIDPPIESTEVFPIKAEDKSREMVKLNGVTLFVQVDTGSDVTLIPRKFWERMDRPKLKKSNLQLEQFDGSIIKILGCFQGTFETKIYSR